MGCNVMGDDQATNAHKATAPHCLAGTMIIDPPSPFAALAEWEDFLSSMQALNDPHHPDVSEAIAMARDTIRNLKGSA